VLFQTELSLLSALATIDEEHVSLQKIADHLDWSESHTARVVGRLESRDYLTTRRDGRRKRVALVYVRPVEGFVDLAREFDHVDFPDLIAGSALRLLYYLDSDRTATELAELTGLARATIYRRLDRLQTVGIVRKNHSRFALTDGFAPLADFARAVATHEHRMEVRTRGVEPQLVWETADEYLFSCQSELTDALFHETGPGIFEQYGIPLLTRNRNHYIRSERLTRVTPAELVCHTLLIDDGARYRSYCLLLIAEHDLERSTLVDVAEHYDREAAIDLCDIVRQLCVYISSGGEVTTTQLPAWEAFETRATEYDIDL
jgi:DNA-binding MarR family transcriptional regulator